MSGIFIAVKESNGRYRILPESPHRITLSELLSVRSEFQNYVDKLRGEGEGSMILAPQTVARDLLKRRCPHLSGFDLIILGFAVTATRIRVWEDSQNFDSPDESYIAHNRETSNKRLVKRLSKDLPIMRSWSS